MSIFHVQAFQKLKLRLCQAGDIFKPISPPTYPTRETIPAKLCFLFVVDFQYIYIYISRKPGQTKSIKCKEKQEINYFFQGDEERDEQFSSRRYSKGWFSRRQSSSGKFSELFLSCPEKATVFTGISFLFSAVPAFSPGSTSTARSSKN